MAQNDAQQTEDVGFDEGAELTAEDLVRWTDSEGQENEAAVVMVVEIEDQAYAMLARPDAGEEEELDVIIVGWPFEGAPVVVDDGQIIGQVMEASAALFGTEVAEG